ncbi:hypothetical protein Bca4012_072087 [Brassica carinata]
MVFFEAYSDDEAYATALQEVEESEMADTKTYISLRFEKPAKGAASPLYLICFQYCKRNRMHKCIRQPCGAPMRN